MHLLFSVLFKTVDIPYPNRKIDSWVSKSNYPTTAKDFQNKELQFLTIFLVSNLTENALIMINVTIRLK